MNVAQETLGFRRQGLSPCLSLLMSAFALLIAPASLSRHLHSLRERSSTTPSNPPSPLIRPTPDCLVRVRFATRIDATHRARSSQNEVAISVLEGLLEIRSFGYRLEPRYIFRAGRLDQ